MGTAKTTPTTPLRNTPSFTSIARLDISFSVLMETLPLPGQWMKSHRVGPGIAAFGGKAKARHQKFPAVTSAGPRHHCASPAHLNLAGQQSLSFEVLDRLRGRDTSHLQSRWPCFLRGRPLHDMRSSRFDMHSRHAADRRELALHKAGEWCWGEHRVLPRIGFLAQLRRSVCQ